MQSSRRRNRLFAQTGTAAGAAYCGVRPLGEDVVTPQSWVELVESAAKRVRWDDIYGPHHDINQRFARQLDWNGLEHFHDEALRLAASQQQYDNVRVKELADFEATMCNILREGLDRAALKKEIRALYFEYFYDGSEGCDGNLFLCDEYTEQDDGWAAEFDPSDVIAGPGVSRYLSYDREFTFSTTLQCIARYYVDAMFLAAAVRAWKNVGTPGVPFGFSEHDGRIILISEA